MIQNPKKYQCKTTMPKAGNFLIPTWLYNNSVHNFVIFLFRQNSNQSLQLPSEVQNSNGTINLFSNTFPKTLWIENLL
jgi:hypothetical protein